MAYQSPSSSTPPFQQYQHHQGSYLGGVDPGSPNNMMLQMGLTYGQSILSRGLQRGEQSFASSYLPFFARLQRYFCVDNTYVRKKLGILLFPFVCRFPPPSATDSSPGAQDFYSTSGGNGPDDASISSPTYSSSAVDFSRGLSAPGYSATGPRNRAGLAPLPTQDCLSFDLYIPLMGGITYIIVSTFLYGLVHKGSVKSDYLLSIASVAAFWLVLGILLVKICACALHVVHGTDILDIISLCGYEYPVICLAVLIRQVTGLGSHVLYLPLVIYAITSVSYFTVRSLIRVSTREDGRVPPRARLFAYVSALVRMPGILWLCYRPFF